MTREDLLLLIDQALDEGWKKLDLSGKELTELPPEIGKLTQLETFNLSSNELKQIPESITQLVNLTALDLEDNQLREIPESISQLVNLTKLDLTDNQLRDLPESITQLVNLTDLYLWGNQLVKLPESISQLVNLTKLNLAFNQLREIPESITQLVNLTDLYLSRNQLGEIPESITQLVNLTKLNLTFNQLREIPESITQLVNLTKLNLWGNQLREIPESITQLVNLTDLYLGGNQLREIPESISQLVNLTELDLSSNQLREIPESISQLVNLTKLDLSSNQLTEIPESITQLVNLTKLDLSSNQLTEIPESITQLVNLTKLYLGGNQLTEIPESITQLVNLTDLYLGGNQLTEVPEWLEELANLEKLDLRQNPLPISPEILGPPEIYQYPGSIEKIFNYCRQLRNGEVRPLNEAKLLLVGQGSVGKTSLINCLIHDKFNPNESQTDGLNVTTWSVHVNSKDVRLNVWDFGGQEIYHATHQFFLTKRSVYVLVCNCRTSEEENRIEYWLKLIESFGGQSPVIIVGNKKDEQPLDINRKALREKYPNIKAIIETSCQTNEGIDELCQAITLEVGQLKEVYDLLPLSWFEVKEHLENMNEDFISYSKYACICDNKNISEENNQDQLIDLLHRLGLVLCFRNHPILQSTNVLNPDWVTEGIYALLSDETLKTKTKGILTFDDLSRILDPQRYPAKLHYYLTELIKEFQLCFQLPDCPVPKFLIPGLLPKDEPENTDLEDNTLEFQYHYRVLPESIMSRFIVLTHEKIHNQIYWRSGVMLAYTENQETYNVARIKADLEDKKIFISIDGRETTRRSFLLMIRDVFNRIHSSFTNPEVSEWVPVPGYPDHPPLDYQELLGLEAMGEIEYPIGKLRTRVNLRQLLDGYEPIEVRQKRYMNNAKMNSGESEEFSKPIQIFNHIHNNNHQGNYKPMTGITNNNQGANIGNLVNEAKDNAQVTASIGSQTSGVSTAELLQLIATMRQTATQFPQDIQEDIIIEIDDVEEELKKPENKRNLTRLQKRLLALAMVGSMMATPIAGITDFTNNALDLANKMGIELQLPSAPK
ncbi:leucine-rich repeat domain-containing protein [Planktothrix paucivesiculata]|uniref:non-specific serine/threonine protein kinase n=1 Tax=Planktothrix paucivesiculata PCC 9631 TaxID=671071 RepID=A0A7Z9C0D1_9CYAN|nr:COR domain-containing protein [Planktothrix paucivesiculata]VXD25427.1 putative Ras family [Planktothrix paucivesiculata PCC 9631]